MTEKTAVTAVGSMRVGPILFSGPMVCALLEGRKTQTRRVFKLPKNAPSGYPIYENPKMGGWEATTIGGGGCFTIGKNGERIPEPEEIGIWHQTCGNCIVAPYQVGDLLYVRETFCYALPGGYDARDDGGSVWWRASDDGACDGPWLPSIHMPRWASRLTLEVTGVKVEQIQDITEEDAIAEGVCAFVEANDNSSWRGLSAADRYGLVCATYGSARNAFHCLWDSLNAKRAPWDSNPWVVALTFTVIKQNVDELLSRLGATNGS